MAAAGADDVTTLPGARRRHLLAALVLPAVTVCLAGAAVFGDVLGWETAAVHPTTLVTANTHFDADQVKEKVTLLEAEQLFRRHGKLPSVTSAYETLQRSPLFGHKVTLVNGGDGAARRWDALDLSATSPPGELILYAPHGPGDYGALELYLRQGKPDVMKLRSNVAGLEVVGMVIASIITVVLSIFLAASALDARERFLGRKRTQVVWRRLVYSSLLGPKDPEPGFVILRAEKEVTASADTIRFVARRYSFVQRADGTGIWHIVPSAAKFGAFAKEWTQEHSIEEIADAWAEFCREVGKLNVANWHRLQLERGLITPDPEVLEAGGHKLEMKHVAALLPAAAEATDLAEIADRPQTVYRG